MFIIIIIVSLLLRDVWTCP